MLIIYCDHCKNKLKSYGDLLFAFYESTVEEYLSGNISDISTDKKLARGYLPIIQFLENKGYILTTESSINTIQVKPLGLRITNICLCCVCSSKMIGKNCN